MPFGNEAFDWEGIGIAHVWSSFWYLLGAAILYLPLVVLLEGWMRPRKPMQLRPLLVLWNAALAMFSAAGAYHLLPWFADWVEAVGVTESVCSPKGYTHPTGYWVWWFMLSKVSG